MTATDTPAPPPPVFRSTPTGPQARLLRRMAGGSVLTAVRTGPRRVLCMVDGHEASVHHLVGLLARSLTSPRAVDATTSEYTLTDAGRGWAAEGGAR